MGKGARLKRVIIFLVLLVSLLATLISCKIPATPGPTATATDPNAIFTAVAQTGEAIRLGKGEDVPTLLPGAFIKTSVASTKTPPPVGTQTTPTVTLTSTNTPLSTIASAPGEDMAEFVEDVTAPDGSAFQPGASFVKTWRLKNSGTSIWTQTYTIVFIDGSLMGASAAVPLPNDVTPGETVDISVELIAPQDEGSHRGEWKLKNTNGQLFGVGIEADEPFWVDILVSESGSPGSTPNPGTTPNSGATRGVFENIIFSVDQADVSGNCPHTFTFTARFTLKDAAAITQQLEAVAPTFAFEIKLPPPVTRNLTAGEHTAVYELKFYNDIQGWARLIFSKPEGVKSNQVNFQLDCQ
jgi:hypothetical protein